MTKRYAADFERAAAGNIVVIRHQHQGAVEYSSYGPNPFFSKSLPHVFADPEKVVKGRDPGQVVQ